MPSTTQFERSPNSIRSYLFDSDLNK